MYRGRGNKIEGQDCLKRNVLSSRRNSDIWSVTRESRQCLVAPTVESMQKLFLPLAPRYRAPVTPHYAIDAKPNAITIDQELFTTIKRFMLERRTPGYVE